MSDLIGGKTLQEIIDMPMSVRHKHMKKYVDPNWGKESSSSALKSYTVEIEYKYYKFASVTYEVLAVDEDEAADVAATDFNIDDDIGDDAEIEDIEVSNE